MSAQDHTRYEQDVGAYLLGALSDLERQAFESHLAACSRCQEEVELLRPAADALPRSVTPLPAPPTLKRSLMRVVEAEARERAGGRARASLGERVRRLLPELRGTRPAVAWGVAAVLLAVGVAGGVGVSKLASGGETQTLNASVDHRRVPLASARLVLPDEGRDGGILRVHGMPSLGSDRTYQAWVQQDGEVIPGPVFGVRRDGSGAAAIPDDLDHASRVMVTREPRGGARAPSEKPILTVKL
jgi:anti-sigma-K factor RskA/putative zinc finger protein